MTNGFARVAFVITAAMAVSALAGCSSSGSAFAGTWGHGGEGEPSLTIEADGSFSGTDGCNPLEGKGTVSGDTFTFGPFASITQACEGVTPWLNLADTAKVDGNALTVYRSDGTEIGTLDND
ncbi:META domain-containing protein [Cryobacterium arcticum]|uniref:META domain-containing protein n=1 Tax=Cryobacterium arcticum TaxID=670052 RepID=A0A317ZKR8_9MICO|nr:META domain-containing protein [Cryobacterium arcticum]PXA67111.1 META domain-containing protein [Cryobacterium arcticum]